MGGVTFWALVAAGVMFVLMALIMVSLIVITQLRRGRRIDAVLLDAAADVSDPTDDVTDASDVSDTADVVAAPTPDTGDET
ncbi:MAG: hypothetical protein LBH11_04385 [Propionibacteriaceae bacterium]|jgi:hypothetical protein|nr:hypothetical protein [Propionibacteriaceae bacterium]